MNINFGAKFLNKPIKLTVLTLLSASLLAMTGCGGERSEAKNASLTVNTPAQITNISKENYDDNKHRSIALRYKIASSVSMTLCLTFLYLTVNHTPSVVYTAIGMSLGALYIWTRPTAKKLQSTSA